MALSKLLLTSVLSLLLMGANPDLATIVPAACDKMTLKTESTQKAGDTRSNLKVIVTGGKEPYHFVLLTDKGSLASEKFKKAEFENLKPGHYKCIVVDDENCKKEIEIDLK